MLLRTNLPPKTSDTVMAKGSAGPQYWYLVRKFQKVLFTALITMEKNQSLHCSVLELSAKTGQLQAREQELLTMLKLKDEVILETTDHITEFTSKFRKLESALRAAKTEELSLNEEKQDLKLRLKELILETNKLKDNLYEKIKENKKQQEEIIHLRQENGCLRNELALIGVAFPAPESNSETDTVRTEGTHETCEECGTAQVPKSRVKITSEMCEVDKRLLLNASDLEETTSAYLNRCQKVVKVLAVLTEEEERQDVASSSDELGSKVFCEANNTRPLRNSEISENGVESRDQQTFESSLPEYEHWLDVSSCIDSPSTLIQNTVASDKTDAENKTWEERTGILFGQKSREAPAAIHKSEADSCSSNNFIIKKDAWWEPVSDPEWLEIFKPVKGDGSIWDGIDCSHLKTAQETNCASSKRLCACYI
ncbi:coiled-coil domain-containing protein 62 isoform x1 [Limosa lapponica baueri]|uniref:Coiled-coil domain-containing protein 62 isoform x1 n=1 Tax=Limosa lapponica baueri TaxID=1758121 RepID=A0A2I0TAJ5_LIMLA|nr:coiled-coil domain-containing protein 62 isoform x1 [Limosa lapponica baueri]